MGQDGPRRDPDRPPGATPQNLEKQVPGIIPFRDPKMVPNLVEKLIKFGHVFKQIWEPHVGRFWGNFGAHSGFQIDPRGTKMGSRGPGRFSKIDKIDVRKGGFRIGVSAFVCF